MSSVTRRTGTFAVAAQTLDLDGLMAFFTAATPAGARGQASPEAASAPPAAVVPLHLDIAIRARKGNVLGIAFTDLSTKARIAEGGCRSRRAEDGRVRRPVRGFRRIRRVGREPRYDWRGTFENLDVPALVAFAGSPGTMTGRLAGASRSPPPASIRSRPCSERAGRRAS